MSILEEVVQAGEDIKDARDTIVADAAKLSDLITGPASGAGSTVDLGSPAGVVNTPAKVIADAEAALLSQWPAPLTVTLDFDDATGSGPATGTFRLGSATQNASTTLRVHETDAHGNSAVGRLAAAFISDNPTKGFVAIVKYGDRSKYLIAPYSAGVDNGSDVDITIGAPASVGEYSATSPFTDGDRCLLIFLPVGNKGDDGDDGAGSGDVQSDDDPTVANEIVGFVSTDKHVEGHPLAALLAGSGHTAVQKVWGPWSGVALAGTCDISAANTIFVKITAGTGPITSFGTTRDGWFRIVRADVGFTITRDATNLETPNGANVTVVAGDILLVARESSESAAKTHVIAVLKADGRAYRGPNDIPQNLSYSGIISPSQITSNQNDYAPTGHQTALIERLSTDASRTLTGLAAPTSGRAEARILINVGSNPLVLSDADASSTAANRFALGANFTIAAGKTIWLWYDTTTTRWRPLSEVLPFGALAILDRVTTIDQNIALSGVISPSQLTANTNDWAPTGLSTASTIRASTDASRNLTGITGGASGRLMFLFNTGSNNLVLKSEDTNSTAANRFAIGADRTLAGGDGAMLIYDATSSRWRVVAIIATGGGGGGGTDVKGVNGFRLSMSTGVPVDEANVSTVTELFLVPHQGNQIGLYDGSSTWAIVSGSQKSIKLTDTQTGTTTNGSPIVTGLTDTAQLCVGMEVTGTGIAGSSVIATIDSATQVTLNNNATASGSNSLTFKVPANTGVDLFVKNVASAPALRMLKRSSLFTKNTTTLQDGVEVLSADTTWRYVGSVQTFATAGQTEWRTTGASRYALTNRDNTRERQHNETFASSGTWTKSLSTVSVSPLVFGGQAGGGGSATGGAGGASSFGAHLTCAGGPATSFAVSGEIKSIQLAASALGSTESVTVGAGGSAGSYGDPGRGGSVHVFETVRY